MIRLFHFPRDVEPQSPYLHFRVCCDIYKPIIVFGRWVLARHIRNMYI